MCVTAASSMRRRSAGPSRSVSSWASTMRPPVVSGRKTSNAEMSKESEVDASQAAPCCAPMTSVMACRNVPSARCGTSTPLGRPVEPEVYRT